MTLKEIREARAFANYLNALADDLDEAGRTATGEDVRRAAVLIENMGRAQARAMLAITSARKHLKRYAA